MLPSERPLRVGIVAGEISGDVLGEGLIKHCAPNTRISNLSASAGHE